MPREGEAGEDGPCGWWLGGDGAPTVSSCECASAREGMGKGLASSSPCREHHGGVLAGRGAAGEKTDGGAELLGAAMAATLRSSVLGDSGNAARVSRGPRVQPRIFK